MKSRIENLSEKKFVGRYLYMSFSDNRTFELWQNFMPHRNEITNKIGVELYSIENFPEGLLENFDPAKEFEKWAAVEVEDFENIPDGMETFISTEGLYAVFIYKGKSSEAAGFYQNIFGNWLPNSEYILDARPHFAVMGEKYKNDSADSEEEIWIPVKRNNQ
jgi:AraC family transcriptional regulator